MSQTTDALDRWRARYPTLAELTPRARRRLPAFAYDFLMGGTGTELSPNRNRTALDAIELIPHVGLDMAGIDPSVTLFGQHFAAPLAIAPIGLDGAIWPGATGEFARAAATTNLPYMTGSFATLPLEQVAGIHPTGTWLQLYTMPDADYRASLGLVERAKAAGIGGLAVTLDIPLPGRRVRDRRHGLRMPFRVTPRAIAQTMTRPAWLNALRRAGMPGFVNLLPYAPTPSLQSAAEYLRTNVAGSGATWDFVARLRDIWTGPLMVKGLLHPRDAERTQALGVDGLVVSNHGGRQFDPAPASIDVLPAIRAAVGPEMTILFDSGVMSGLDILRALACGADAVLAGRAFMIALAALGPGGATYAAEVMLDEFRIALGQSGALTPAGARHLDIRHPGRWQTGDFAGPARAAKTGSA
ncbi:MAG: alpha-hydroxy-acid oxidizing protein [Qingshengfaniella sp.]